MKKEKILCISCSQTIENCECYIAIEDKHKGLIKLVEAIIKDEKFK